ncbi:hypothetical protein J1N35_028727 [Gossypium stocksii]|uniref:Uncharacterized protein n=1 Tax=Gossypium stocksii TaxID=47602 RepID=A0A9D3UWX8_9ROSI|nr:hypothetical protein J1N35_028727 [Gossypium stocksii]
MKVGFVLFWVFLAFPYCAYLISKHGHYNHSHEARAKEKATAILVRKVTLNKTKKIPKLEEIPALLGILTPPMEPIHKVDSPIYTTNPPQIEILIETLPPTQPVVSSYIPPHDASSSEVEGIFPWRELLKSRLSSISLGSIFQQQNNSMPHQLKEALTFYLSSNLDLSPLALLEKASQTLFVEHELWSWAFKDTSGQ